MRKSKYTRDLLAPIVAEASSVTDVLRRLGLPVNGGNWRYIRARIRNVDLDTSHFQGAIARRVSRLTADELGTHVVAHTSFAQVAAALGLPTYGGAHRRLKSRIEKLSNQQRQSPREPPPTVSELPFADGHLWTPALASLRSSACAI